MREQIEARLTQLRTEYGKGQAQLRQLDGQMEAVRETLLRIGGAVMILEELVSCYQDSQNKSNSNLSSEKDTSFVA